MPLDFGRDTPMVDSANVCFVFLFFAAEVQRSGITYRYFFQTRSYSRGQVYKGSVTGTHEVKYDYFIGI